MTIHLPCNICICLDLWRPASVYSQTFSTFEPFVSLILGRTFLLTQWFTLFIQAFVSLHVALFSKLSWSIHHIPPPGHCPSAKFGLRYSSQSLDCTWPSTPLDPVASVYHLLLFIPLLLMSFHPNHIPPSFPCPTARVWLGQPAKQSGCGYSVVRHACKVAQPLQPSPLGLLSSSLCITLPLPHFSDSDTFSSLLTVGDSQYVPDTSVIK